MTFEDLEELHYITPIANMESILKHGIVSHQKAERILHQSVAMNEIQEKRKKVVVPGGRPLHQYVNLYFHARNPMMFKGKDMHKDLCIIQINKEIINLPDVVISDGNAASDYVRFYAVSEGLRVIDKELVFARYWKHDDPIENFRHTSIKCSEVLVPDKVDKDFIFGAYVSCDESKERLYAIIEKIEREFPITVNPDLFFQMRGAND